MGIFRLQRPENTGEEFQCPLLKRAVDALRFFPKWFLLFERVVPVMSETVGVYVPDERDPACQHTEKNPPQASRY